MAKKRTEDLEKNKELRTCFVIMPFGNWFDTYYREVYKPAILESGLEPIRADDIYRPSVIVKDIWEMTQKADIILADLTGKNANVFYELGLAHALAKPVVLIANTMDDVPFDLRSLRVIEFDKNESNWGDLLRNKIRKSIKETLESPINSVLPAFLDKESLEETQITISEKDVLQIKRDMDLLKSQIRQIESSTKEEYTFPNVSLPSRGRVGQFDLGHWDNFQTQIDLDYLNKSNAKEEIVELLKKDISTKEIFSEIKKKYGVEDGWIRQEIDKGLNRADVFSAISKNKKG